MPKLENLVWQDGKRTLTVSTAQVNLAAGLQGQNTLGSLSHDLTVHSTGVLADVRAGRLKRDLSNLLARPLNDLTAKRALAVLHADLKQKTYTSRVIDPEKQKFEKGSVLVVNLSSQTGIVILGTSKKTVVAGAQEVVKPVLEANGMYRLLVAHLDEDKKPIPCYDRYVPNNPDSRDVLFLLNDANTGLKVFSLPIFGTFE